MKLRATILSLFAAAATAWGAVSDGSTVTGTISDLVGSATTVKVTFTPLTAPMTLDGSWIVSGRPRTYTATNGAISLWLNAGQYQVAVGNSDKFKIDVPTGGGTNDIGTVTTEGIVWTTPGGGTGEGDVTASGVLTNGSPLLGGGLKLARATNAAGFRAVIDAPALASPNTFTGSSNVFSGIEKLFIYRPWTNHNSYREGVLQIVQTNSLLLDHSAWDYVGLMGVESSIQVQAPDAGIDLISDPEGYHGSYLTLRNMSEKNKQSVGYQIYLTQSNFPTWGGQLMFIPMGTNLYPMDAEWTDWRITMGTNVGAAGMSLGVRGSYPNVQWQDLNGNAARRIATMIYSSDTMLLKTSRDDHSSPINAHSWDAFGTAKHEGTDAREVFYQSGNTSGERRWQWDTEADGDVSLTFDADDASTQTPVVTFSRSGTTMPYMDMHSSGIFGLATEEAGASNSMAATTAYADRTAATAAAAAVAAGGGGGVVSNYAELYVGDLILTNAIAVPSGGTGTNTLTQGYVLVGAGTNPVTTLSPATWQATNANLTLLSAYGPATWQSTNAALTALATSPAMYQATNAALTTYAARPGAWTSVTPDGTNAVINLAAAVPGVDVNFYYSLSTSNHIIFSNLVAGAQGTIWINCAGAAQNVNFSGSYDNFSTNDFAPPFAVTNRAIVAFKVGWGADATNVMLGIKRK